MKKGLIVLLAVMFVAVAFCVSAEENKFVGADKCKGCHPSEYKDFESRKFTKAWNVLQMRGKTKDAECLKCHVTGYGEPGGFVSEEETPHLKYKQCEACHGAGGAHAANPGDMGAKEAMKSYVKDKDVCIKCHLCMKTHKSADF
ncbi:MAG: cytochrome c family protein [Candidatus Omnitrophica bacterium]|nr:cytochrome c family protein [Candidatus Omnitrophota bacterium]